MPGSFASGIGNRRLRADADVAGDAEPAKPSAITRSAP